MRDVLDWSTLSSIVDAAISLPSEPYRLLGRMFEPIETDPVAWLQRVIEQLADGPPKVRVVGLGPKALDYEFPRRVDFDGTIRFDVRPSAVQRLLERRATVVLNRCERADESLFRLVKELKRARLSDVAANAYLSTPTSETFGWHVDTHDVLVLQLAGSKRWEICTSPQRPTEHTAPSLVEELRAGEVLAVRRNVWHSVQTTSDVSLHVTVGLFPLTFGHLAAASGTYLDSSDGGTDLCALTSDERAAFLVDARARLDALLRLDPLIAQDAEDDDVDSLASDVSM